MAFHVGQRVVFIAKRTKFAGLPSLKYGEVCEITKISVSGISGKTVLLVNGCKPGKLNGYEVWFDGEDFRPLQEQGMSILRAILADPKVKIKEPA